MYALARQVQLESGTQIELCRSCFNPFVTETSHSGPMHCGCQLVSVDESDADALSLQILQRVSNSGGNRGSRLAAREFRVSMPSLFERRTVTLQGLLRIRRILSIRVKVAVSQ